MDDTIYRQAAIDAFCKECYDTDGEICDRDNVCGNVMILKNMPSAQPEIVRCKDCKFADCYVSSDGVMRCYCMSHGSSGHDIYQDYCSYAERRTDDGD